MRPQTASTPTPITSDAHAGRSQVAERAVLAVAESVPVEQGVAPEAVVAIESGGDGVQAVLVQVEIRGRVLAEGAARGQQAQRGHQHEHAQPDPGPAPGQARRLGLAVGLELVGHVVVVDPQHRQVGLLQVGHDPGGEHQLDHPGHQQVGQHHGRDGLGQVERGVQRRAVGRVEQHRLQAQLDGAAQGGRVQADVAARCRRPAPAWGRSATAAGSGPGRRRSPPPAARRPC